MAMDPSYPCPDHVIMHKDSAWWGDEHSACRINPFEPQKAFSRKVIGKLN
jgi:hypothetical protein